MENWLSVVLKPNFTYRYIIDIYEIKSNSFVATSKQKINWCLDFIDENKSSIIFTPSLKFVEIIKEKLMDDAYYITGNDKSDLYNAIIKADKPVIATYAIKEGANLLHIFS